MGMALLDLAVIQGFEFFYDLLQASAALGVVLLGGQSTALLRILLIKSLDITDLGL
jgi:hypothetical protein